MNDNGGDTVGGYTVPVDPMDDLQCESCQMVPIRKNHTGWDSSM